MTNEELIAECKKALNISLSTTALDGVLLQKLLAVKGYMSNAGVSDAAMNTDLGVGVIVLGVADLWEVEGGEAKFSPVFHTLLSQLAMKSETDLYAFTVTYNGNGNTDGGVPVDRNIYGQGDTAIVLSNFGNIARTGYTFAGWNTKADGSGADYAGGSSIKIGVSSIILYAKWVAE